MHCMQEIHRQFVIVKKTQAHHHPNFRLSSKLKNLKIYNESLKCQKHDRIFFTFIELSHFELSSMPTYSLKIQIKVVKK